MTPSVWLFIILAMCFYGIGEYYSKIFANTKQYFFMMVSFIGYSINGLLFYPAMLKFNSLSILGTIWNVGYVFITLILGLVIFHEPVTLKQVIGILFAVLGVILLS